MLSAVLLVAACGDQKAAPQAEAAADQTTSALSRAIKITTAVSSRRDVEIKEIALGRIIDPVATTIGAELPGRVMRVLVDAGEAVRRGQLLILLDDADVRAAAATANAELKRLQAQQQAQRNLVERYRKMIAKQFISPTLLEQAEAQMDVLHQGVAAAQARLHQAENNLKRSRVVAPVDGRIDQRLVAAGDYIGLGKPLLRMASGRHLSVAIPLPETHAARLHKGQLVRLHLPADKRVITTTISDLTPMVGRSNAFEVRVELENPGNWRPGGSVMAEIVIDRHQGAVTVPEECIVLRPAGTVVYQLDQGIARAVPVEIGVQLDGHIEVVSGLHGGELLAATGAAYLSDGAAVDVQVTGSKP